MPEPSDHVLSFSRKSVRGSTLIRLESVQNKKVVLHGLAATEGIQSFDPGCDKVAHSTSTEEGTRFNTTVYHQFRVDGRRIRSRADDGTRDTLQRLNTLLM